MTDHLTKIEALNNVDIRCGMLHDSEVRVWVNCNWVLDYIYDVRPSEVTCGMAEALLETWETHIQELKDDEYNDDCWNLAKAEYKNDQDE